MRYIGAHVSIAGGFQNAPTAAHQLGATGFAMFTKSQRQWFAKPITDEEAATFQACCREFGFGPESILAHDSYLINLGQPDPDKRQNSLKAFIDELERCRKLGIRLLNFHPGSHVKMASEEEDIRIIAESVKAALNEVPDVVAVFENTAGQGSNMGYTFEQLAAMLEQVGMPERTGVCIDTCHAFAAGYDMRTQESFSATFDAFEKLIGFSFLRGMHLNDAKGVLGQKLDRHASLGDGSLGWDPFRMLMEDSRFDGIPLVLETPEPERWSREIETLRKWCH